MSRVMKNDGLRAEIGKNFKQESSTLCLKNPMTDTCVDIQRKLLTWTVLLTG